MNKPNGFEKHRDFVARSSRLYTAAEADLLVDGIHQIYGQEDNAREQDHYELALGYSGGRMQRMPAIVVNGLPRNVVVR